MEKKEIRAKFREALKNAAPGGGWPMRSLLLAYAYVRGMKHEQVERRISEHNLPYPHSIEVCLERMIGEEELKNLQPPLREWLGTEVKKYGPRVPKMRRSKKAA